MSKFIKRDESEFVELDFLAYYLYKINGFIAGGCFKNVVEKQTLKDIDIFFENEEDFNEALEVYEESESFEKLFENEKCVGFVNVNNGIKVDLVRSIFGSMETVINYFDFTITKFAYRRQFIGLDEDELPIFEYEIIHHKEFFQHLAQKRLVIDNRPDELTFPASTFERMFRYAKYGYQPCRETKIKIVEALRLLDDFSSDDLSKSMYEGGFD